MGVFIAVIIILVLILYAIKDLLAEKDLSLWINIALTALVLFTVILSIFMILHKGTRENLPGEGYDKNKPAATEAADKNKQNSATAPKQEQSDEEVLLEIAEEYVLIEDDYQKRNPEATDAGEVASNYIKQKYQFTDEEWDNFMKQAEEKQLFAKARQKINADHDIDYLIAK